MQHRRQPPASHRWRLPKISLPHRPLPVALAAVVAGGLLATLALLLTAGAGSLMSREAITAESLPAAAGAGAAGAAATLIAGLWRRRRQALLAAMGGLAAAVLAVFAIGPRSLSVTTPSVQVGCFMGLPRCVLTGDQAMSMLVKGGPVQRRPVVHLIAWGLTPSEQATVSTDLHHVGKLGQPLLQEVYQVAPAKPGGEWIAPGSAAGWLQSHHLRSLPVAELKSLIAKASAAKHWKDTTDTQWWIATHLTATQMGLSANSCADHIRLPSVKGAVVRLPLNGCSVPQTRARCPAVAVSDPTASEPVTRSAGTSLLIGHEFAEAATDPANGWRVLVSPRCGNDMWLEIADVCAPNSAFIQAPYYRTSIGWQPPLLVPGRNGKPAYCADPANPLERQPVLRQNVSKRSG